MKELWAIYNPRHKLFDRIVWDRLSDEFLMRAISAAIQAERDRADLLQQELTKANEMILCLFDQSAYDTQDSKYDHMCISTYESAQEYLIERGLIKAEECSRK